MTETSRHAPPTLTRSLAASCVVTLALLLAACASGPGKAPSGRDGPEARPPSGLSDVPDAQPRVEPIRSGGPNKPYEVLGKDYSPMREDGELTERGLASWYGKKFHGRKTASGETYNMYAMTAAHKTMPIPSYARVRNPKNGREIIVRVNDRGPFHAGRVIDLSYTAALKLGVLNGVAPVEVERITFEQIRTGSWQRGNTAPAAPAPEPEPVVVATAPVAPPPVVPAPATVPDTPRWPPPSRRKASGCSSGRSSSATAPSSSSAACPTNSTGSRRSSRCSASRRCTASRPGPTRAAARRRARRTASAACCSSCR